MTQQIKTKLFVSGIVITPFVFFCVSLIFGKSSVTIGNNTLDVSLLGLIIFFFVIKLALFISDILFVVQGFRVHWGWGLANLVIPFAIIGFCIRYPREARSPLIVLGIGVVFPVITFFAWWLAS